MTTEILFMGRAPAQQLPEVRLQACPPSKRGAPALAVLLLAAMAPMAAQAIDVDSRPTPPADPSHAGWPQQACWPTCWCPSIATTCLLHGRP
jgi:hypothetical protein